LLIPKAPIQTAWPMNHTRRRARARQDEHHDDEGQTPS
jgi:hypothetical protein